MITQRRTNGSASGLAVFTFALLASGCGVSLESNQAACRRAINHVATCGDPSVDLPPEADFLISQLCAAVPETSECDDWPALADCVAAVSCIEMFTFNPQTVEACDDIQVGMEMNGCFPGGF